MKGSTPTIKGLTSQIEAACFSAHVTEDLGTQWH